MNALLKKWRTLTRQQRLMLIIVAVLCVLVAFRYINLPENRLPLPGVISAKEDELVTQVARYQKLSRNQRSYEMMLSRLRRQVGPLLWQMDDKVPSAALQAELENMARKAHVTIQTTGSQRTNEVADHLRSVEAAVRVNGTMTEVSRFLEVLENAEHNFVWHSCRIRPVEKAGATTVNLSGRIKAYFLTPETEKMIFADLVSVGK